MQGRENTSIWEVGLDPIDPSNLGNSKIGEGNTSQVSVREMGFLV